MSKDTGVKVRVIHDFFDKENDLTLRATGTQFSASPDRADYLKNLGYVEIVKPEREEVN